MTGVATPRPALGRSAERSCCMPRMRSAVFFLAVLLCACTLNPMELRRHNAAIGGLVFMELLEKKVGRPEACPTSLEV